MIKWRNIGGTGMGRSTIVPHKMSPRHVPGCAPACRVPCVICFLSAIVVEFSPDPCHHVWGKLASSQQRPLQCVKVVVKVVVKVCELYQAKPRQVSPGEVLTMKRSPTLLTFYHADSFISFSMHSSLLSSKLY